MSCQTSVCACVTGSQTKATCVTCTGCAKDAVKRREAGNLLERVSPANPMRCCMSAYISPEGIISLAPASDSVPVSDYDAVWSLRCLCVSFAFFFFYFSCRLRVYRSPFLLRLWLPVSVCNIYLWLSCVAAALVTPSHTHPHTHTYPHARRNNLVKDCGCFTDFLTHFMFFFSRLPHFYTFFISCVRVWDENLNWFCIVWLSLLLLLLASSSGLLRFLSSASHYVVAAVVVFICD